MSETISSGTVNITSSWIGVVREKRTSSYNEKKNLIQQRKTNLKKKDTAFKTKFTRTKNNKIIN